MRRFKQTHIDHYRDHGFVIVENFLTPEELSGARKDLSSTLPGWVEYCDDPSLPKPEGWETGRNPGGGPTQFPYAGPCLNDITLHPELRAFAAEMMDHNDLYCEQSHLTAKCKDLSLIHI